MAAAASVPAPAAAPGTAAAAALGEVEDEGLLASLFRDRFPGARWRERPDAGRYLRELSGSGLERLRREPERLAEERAQLLQQTRDLAFANYKTFIRGAECTERIHRLFGDVEASLGRLLERLPGFQQSCRCDGPGAGGAAGSGGAAGAEPLGGPARSPSHGAFQPENVRPELEPRGEVQADDPRASSTRFARRKTVGYPSTHRERPPSNTGLGRAVWSQEICIASIK